MNRLRALFLFLVLPLAAIAADSLKIDRTKSFVDVDVKATVDSFTGRLENYDVQVGLDEAGKIKTAVFTFKFAHLKSGKADRDAKMLEWLGGGDPDGRFELGALAVTRDGQGQATGRLTFHGTSQLIEFPVEVQQLDSAWTITGAATVKYTNWGLKVIRMALLLKVDPEVKVRFKIVGTPVEAAK